MILRKIDMLKFSGRQHYLAKIHSNKNACVLAMCIGSGVYYALQLSDFAAITAKTRRKILEIKNVDLCQ